MSKRSSRSRPSRATRWLTFFGLALATYRADGAAPTEWPVKKDADYGHVSVKNFDDSTSAGHLKINTGAGTTIKAAAASTGGDIFANGYTATADGISARLKTVEDRLAQLRDDFDNTSVAELTDLHDKCTSVYDTLNQKIDALETDINSTAFTPPECSNDTKMRGIVRIDGEWVCMCKGNYTTSTGTDQSDYGTCDVSPCALPSSFLNDANVVQNCAKTHLKEGDTCTFSCKDYYRPNAAATQGIDGELTCASGTASGSTHCVVCTDNYSGPNCEDQSCDLGDPSTAGTYYADPLVTDVDCNTQFGRYLNASHTCNYDCVAGYMPSAVTTTNTSGTIECHENAGTTTPAAPRCRTCAEANYEGYTGRNCEQEPCMLSSIFSVQSPIPHFLAGDCDTGSYLQADGTCNFDCEAGYMPVGVSNTGAGPLAPRRGTLTCSNDGGITTDDAGATVTSSSTLCQTCSGIQYSGQNCGLDSCVITSVLTKTNVSNVDCDANYLAAGASCTYNCTGSMPILASTYGQSGTISCDNTGAVSGADGITPESTGAFCQSCADGGFPGYKGTNCEIEPCDLSVLTFDDNFRNVDCQTGTYMEADDTCTFNCADGYMPDGGTRGSSGSLTCSSTGGNTLDDDDNPLTGSVTLCTACTSQYSGQNCGLNSCVITSVLAKTNVSNVDCDANYLAAGASCTYDCADGSMPIDAKQTGQSGTISCDNTGAVDDGDDGITPESTGAFCKSCADFGVPGNTGVNCATAPTQGSDGQT